MTAGRALLALYLISLLGVIVIGGRFAVSGVIS